MNDFINLIQSESISTIEGLTGRKPNIINDSIVDKSQITIQTPFIKIILENNSKSQIIFITPSILAATLSDLMLGGNGFSTVANTDISSDDLDAIKEITSNIFGAVSTTLKGQKILPIMEFKVVSADILKESENFDGFDKGCLFKFNLDNLHSEFVILFSQNLINEFNPKQHSDNQINNQKQSESTNLNHSEIRNIAMLLDVKMQVRVRIGQKKMLLKDVISMDIGSVVELNQLANDPLEILVDDKVIAKGEVVIIDGNFGVQITEIGTKRERLEQLKG
ncbi:flagellar motor switch protein FliY [Helicobacter sp. MIT 14-3879]|uniref:flagellar motor switch protein FliY n=1 Tax=Helicobacter sp. MIT 14-3879 TaxID=2040649 RepID=UPI000E1E703A|nr:flagellar motor switch protein FliY [Helicobacter sp. MIT 14-3879]RDU65168.1 flagellar motor switch protein FliY [Helicobacter sp. MIT 14-3879]